MIGSDTPPELLELIQYVEDKRVVINDDIKELKGRLDDICSRCNAFSRPEFIRQFDEIYDQFLSRKLPNILEGIAQELKEINTAIEQTEKELANAMR